MEIAASGLDPIIGRELEINLLVRILLKKATNNPLLCGESGVGKTATVRGLAQKICKGDVPKRLLGRSIISLNMVSLATGVKSRGEYEERLQTVIKEVENSSDTVILFVDDLHTLLGCGSEISIDAANLLKLMLARGKARCIGTTTYEEYKKHIMKDAALDRNFQVVRVDEPTLDETIGILRGLKEKYEQYHCTHIEEKALLVAAQLSGRYITGMHNQFYCNK